jgi:hypothetical protein
MSKYVVIIYDYGTAMTDLAFHFSRISAEEKARADGYQIMSDDGNGIVTYVTFDNDIDAIAFKLKYL